MFGTEYYATVDLIYTCGCATSLTAGLLIPCQHFMIYDMLYWNTCNNCKPPVVNIGLDHPIIREMDWTDLVFLKVLCFTSLLCSWTSCCCVHGSGYCSCGSAFFMDTEPWGWLSWKMWDTRIQGKQQGGKWVMSQTKDINKSTKESIRFHATVLKSIIYLWTLKFFDWRCFSLQASQTTRSVVSANSVDDWLKTSYWRFGLKFVARYGHGQYFWKIPGCLYAAQSLLCA